MVLSNLVIPELDNADTELSRMKCYEFIGFSKQNLICCLGILVVSDRFFGVWSFGMARCGCSL